MERYRWDLFALSADVLRLHSESQSKQVTECTQSLVKRLAHARYHYLEARRLVMDDMAASDRQTVLIRYVLPGHDSDVIRRRDEAEAHLIAFMQAMHSVADILAYAVYLALGLNLKAETVIEDRKISARSVAGKLPLDSAIRRALQAMLDDDEVRHTSALVNRAKHRAIVGMPASVSFVEDAHGVAISAFVHHGTQYPQRWANTFASSAFDHYQYHILKVGEILMGVLDERR
jgi:hypothetical protein